MDGQSLLKSEGVTDAQAPKTLPCDLACPKDTLEISLGVSAAGVLSNRTGEAEEEVLLISSFLVRLSSFKMGSLRIHVLDRELLVLNRLFLMIPRFWVLLNWDEKGFWTKRRLFQALLVFLSHV